MIKATRLAEEIQWQFKRINSDYMITALLICSQRNHQIYLVNQNQAQEFDFTYWDISNYS